MFWRHGPQQMISESNLPDLNSLQIVFAYSWWRVSVFVSVNSNESDHVVCCQVISECCALLEKECVSLSTHVRVLPLHVDLSAPAAQQVEEVEEECVRRRVILTDVLGESSFSLNNIRYVIDTGLQLKTVSLSSSYKHLINFSPSYLNSIHLHRSTTHKSEQIHKFNSQSVNSRRMRAPDGWAVNCQVRKHVCVNAPITWSRVNVVMS